MASSLCSSALSDHAAALPQRLGVRHVVGQEVRTVAVASRARSPSLNAKSARASVRCSAAVRQTSTLAADVATSARPISFQFGETSFSVQFTPELANQLKDAIDKLLQTFREKEKATKPQRWQGLEFRHNADGVFIEIFCNPNAYSNAFQAKALVTIKSDVIKLSSEGPLSDVKSSVEEYIVAS